MEKAFVKQKAHDIFIQDGLVGEGHYFHGNSMLPLFREADNLLLMKVDWARLKVGDIVVYRDDLKYPTRRIVKKNPDNALVVGDHWIDQRQVISKEMILAVVHSRSRGAQIITANNLEWKLLKYICLIRFQILNVPVLIDTLAKKLARTIRRRVQTLWN